MHTFFCDAFGGAGTHPVLEARERDHLFKTLRARPGEELRLFDGRGGIARARVLPGRELEILTAERCVPPARNLLLYTAVPRRAKFDVLLKQAAELGVGAIQPVECERSVAQPEGSSRWTTLLQEGCKQSGNPFLPEIRAPLTLGEAVARLRSEGVAMFFGAVARTGEPSAPPPPAGDLAWFVGPEGGFTGGEERMLRGAGVRGLHLGPYILRLETAAVCGLAVLRQWMEEGRS